MPTPERYLLIDEETGEVVNVVLWDGVSPWSPPEGLRAEREAVSAQDAPQEWQTWVQGLAWIPEV